MVDFSWYEGSLVTLLTYYAPNTDQLGFFQTLFQTLSSHFQGMLLLGGNSNVRLDSFLDRTCPPGSQVLQPSRMGTKFAKLLHDYNLVDI